MMSQILLILIDFDTFWPHFAVKLLFFKLSLTLKLEEILNKETVNGDCPDFCCSLEISNKTNIPLAL